MLKKYILDVYRLIDQLGVWLYMRVYKRPDLIRSAIRYFIPKRFKVRFICDKNYRVFGFRSDPAIERFRLVHIVPPSVLLQRERYLGSVKDIAAKAEVFKEIYGNAYCQFVAPKGDKDLYYFLKFNHKAISRLHQKVVLYIDMPGSFMESVALLRRLLPYAVIVFRAHNAEGKHNYEKFVASLNPKWLSKAFFSRRSDAAMVEYVDRVDVISKYDIDEYWSRISSKKSLGKIRHLPFFYAPSVFGQYFSSLSIVTPGASKVMACFGSIGKTNVLNNRGVRKLLDTHSRIVGRNGFVQFVVTGDYRGKQPCANHAQVEFVGVLDDPNTLLARADCLIDLSSIGYGFKTKFLDAALCGCRLVLDAAYIPRIPLEYYPFVSVLQADGGLFNYSSHSRDDLREFAAEINARNHSHARKLLNFDNLGVV